MFQNNPLLMKLKKKLNKKNITVEGIVRSTTKKYGFLELDSQKTYFISAKNMKKVMDGDRIIGILNIKNNREMVYPKKLIEPFLKKFVGNIYKINDSIFIQPSYPYMKNVKIRCVCDFNKNTLENGDWVLGKLTQHYLKQKNSFKVKIIEFIVQKTNPLAPWYVILTRYNLEKHPPDIKKINQIYNNNFNKLRKNLTHLDFVTIDNCNTKDIDDAVFVKKTLNNNFSLTIAIADPTEYISNNTELDDIAKQRSFTNYLPGLNIPMLPKILSEDLCSLKQYKIRPVLACRVIIDIKGNILYKDLKFFLAYIQSKEQLSYDNVSNWLEKTGKWNPKNEEIKKTIIFIKKIYEIRSVWRKKNALTFINSPDYRFNLSEKREVLGIFIEHRRVAHKIIEECMITANICAAFFLKKNLGFGLYNTHIGFDIFNATAASNFLRKYNIIFKSHEIMTLKGFCKLHKYLKNLSNKYIYNRICKFQAFGEISLIPQEHFALGLEYYATWTSPIRKYSDIINHRLIKSVLMGLSNIKKPDPKIITHITNRRRCYRIAGKELEKWLYVQFFLKFYKNNQYLQGIITDIFKNGIQVRLIKHGAFVFIPASFMHKLKKELSFNTELGVVYIYNKIYYYVTDIIKVRLLSIKKENNTIIASII
ncbi:exoribonuclease II [Buchnera aphidicola (Cinara tujafilina)]|uniref:Exoribonuclease II n=1 Tax=Buchnera aphidicola (Cinara tujafilina) TaxID=261317 RepID=F7WZA0_9GAMM|nr:exoribonuclease II [Buchnera aphidicola]AEH39758.1 exoribonuclease II [Buchnera aphidicola (Cinara tujafilina)]